MLIGNMEFKTKKGCLNFYKDILHKYNFGEAIIGDDYINLCNLLSLHNKADRKIGVGILAIRVIKGLYGLRMFEIERTDHTKEVFSYIKIINAPASTFSKFSTACRNAVQPDITRVKQQYFKRHIKNQCVKCQETGEMLRLDELQADHRAPYTFSMIVNQFIELNDIDIDTVVYEDMECVGRPDSFADIELSNRFREYHKSKAKLRIISKSRNLHRSSLARITQSKKDIIIE